MLEATSRSPKEAQDQRAEVGQDIARQLQQARLARGEDLADIARQLHIRPAYLAALEQGQFELSVGGPTSSASCAATAPTSASTATNSLVR
jgi:ribosome-binding protein aMBF1 (putative translation factor)